MIRKFKLPDNGIPIRVGQSSFIHKDVYHPIEWHGGEPYRPRVETLVLKKSGPDVIYMELKEKNHYRIPGGSIDSDSTFEKQAENETNEEALLKVSDLAFANIEYYQEMDKDYIAKGGDSCIPYVGAITHVYTAYESGNIDKSTIEEKDLDNEMAKNGKFHHIRNVVRILRVDHIKALINSGRIRDKGLEAMLYARLQELMVEQPPATIFETHESGEMETKYIYHGSAYDFDVFHPMSLDLGNADQEPGWSTFCFREYTLARRFALMRLIQKVLDGEKDKYHVCGWDLKENKPFLHHTVYAEVLNAIEHEKIFVYTVDATPLALGIGNDERFPEVTFREDNVVPYKKDVIFTDEDTIRDDIHTIDKEPKAYEKAQMDNLANLNRGWVTCMLNRDYSGDDAVAKLTKAVSDGELKPGDDVVVYMDTHGITLKDISFIERLHDAKVAAEEGFDLSEEFEETIYMGDHKAIITSEKKTGDAVYDYDGDVPREERFGTIPEDVNMVHKAYLYELGNKGELTSIGYYHVFELGLLDEDLIYKPQKYLLHLMIYPNYRNLGIGNMLLGYAIRYHKKHFSDYELIAEIPNSSWGHRWIQNWAKSYTTKRVLRNFSHVAVTLNNIDGIAMESVALEYSEQNLSNLEWYHAEMERSGFDPKFVSGWDEELYSKTIDHAIKQTFMGAVGKDKSLLDKKSFTMHMYTAGEGLSPIYLGKVTMYYYGLEDDGYTPKYDWEWAEQEDFSAAFLSNLKEEVHPHLMEGVVAIEETLIESVDIEDVSDSDGIDIVEEGMADTLLSPVFIVCTFTGTRFGKIVTKIQDCKFSHSGLALDSDLKKIYTYNMLAKAGGGAGIESIDMYKNVSTGGDGDVCVMCFFVPTPVKDKIKQVVEYVFSNVKKTSYAFGNLLNILVNRAVDTKNSLQMVCSQFVDFCLKAANVDLTKKSSNLVSPNDFANIPKSNPKVFVLFDGKKSEYNRRKAENKIHRLLRSREPEELNVVAEGIELYESANSSITFSKSSFDIKTIVHSMSDKEHFYIGADAHDQIWNEKNAFYKDVLLVNRNPVAFLMVFEVSNKPGVGFIIIGVHSNYRKMGYGQVLIDRLKRAHLPDRVKSLCWGVDKGNDASENLAKKNGFSKEGDTFRSGKIPLYLETETFQTGVNGMGEFILPDGFRLPEQGEFDRYKHLADLDAARESIPDDVMEGWLTALMEASKDKKDKDGLPSLGRDDKTEDYSADAEQDEEDDETDENTEDATDNTDDEGDDETEDYTADAGDEDNEGKPETEDNPEEPQQDDNSEPDDLGAGGNDYTADAAGDDAEQDTATDDQEGESSTDSDDTTSGNGDTDGADSGTDDLDAEGTDYTSDADSSGDDGDAGSDDASGDSETDSSDSGTEQETNTQSNNNGVKNHSLLNDFEGLYRLASEISDTIEPIIMEKPIQNKVLTQVRANLTTIKSALMNFITTYFKADDYSFNLYYYEVFIGLLSKNLMILQKNKEFSSKDSKKDEKKEKE